MPLVHDILLGAPLVVDGYQSAPPLVITAGATDLIYMTVACQ